MTAPSFYLAAVDATDSTWSTSFERNDYDVVALEMRHDEGDKPTLKVTVKNPQAGLLRSGAKVYCWLSYNPGSGIIPLLFGRLEGIPSNIIGTTVQLKFIADPPNYLAQKQAVAEKLKTRPNYDPIFLDPAHRDDPDAILEGWCRAFHVDRVTNVVTTSDITFGEDGTIEIEQQDAVYDSVRMDRGRSPLTIIEVDATVGWNQHAVGTIDLGHETFETFSGDAILRDWPKAGTEIGGGWYVESATCVDSWNVQHAVTASWTYDWHNGERVHAVGDTLSLSQSMSVPALVAGTTRTALIRSQPGFLDPFGVDGDGDPDPLNIPASAQSVSATAALWHIETSLTLGYQTNRPRTERVRFALNADLQPLLTYTDASTNAETITRSGANVDFSITDVEDWLSVAGQAVGFGQVIFVPQNTLTPIEIPSYQVCIAPGTTSSTEPAFSPTPGVLTTTGSATFASLGPTLLSDFPDWPPNTVITTGYVTRPVTRLSIVWDQLVPPFPAPLAGAAVSLGQFVRSNDGTTYFQVTQAGVTGLIEPVWNKTYGTTTNSGGAIFTSVGPALPDGTTFWLATTPGTTAAVLLPPFGAGTAGTTVSDGSVVWTSLGTGGSLIGVPIKDVTRRSYFPSERGLWSIEYLICLARAHLLARARAIKISCDCDPEKVYGLSCRMNVRIHDPRIPGGAAVGKVTSYGLRLDGDEGGLFGFVTIGCTIGNGISVATASGSGDYCDDDYAETGWEEFEGVVIAVPSGDVGYSVPSDAPDDDGLVFPLTAAQGVLVNTTHHPDQGGAVDQGLATALLEAEIQAIPTGSFAASVQQQMRAMQLGTQNLANQLQAVPVWKELQLIPLTGNSFNTEYAITTTVLTAMKGIDLEAPSA